MLNLGLISGSDCSGILTPSKLGVRYSGKRGSARQIIKTQASILLWRNRLKFQKYRCWW